MARDRFDGQVDRTFDTKPDTFERVEVISGAGRRRSWPLDVKARMVMESLEDGAIISGGSAARGSAATALRLAQADSRSCACGRLCACHGGWRENGITVSRATAERRGWDPLGEIEIAIGMAVIRIRSVPDVKTLTAVLRAMKAAL